MSRALTDCLLCLKNQIEKSFYREGANEETLMNISHVWTSHGFNLLLNCLFEYSHLKALLRRATERKHIPGIIERLINSFESARKTVFIDPSVGVCWFIVF